MLSPASKEVPISLAVDPRSHITSVTVRDMSTHTNEVVVTLTCAGIECEVNDVEEGPSKTMEKIKYEQPQMKDRVCKMEYVPQVSELDVLLAIFPYEDIINISHYYQMLGLEECVKLFVELGAYVEWNATVVEGAFNEEIAAAEVSATCPHGPPPITNWQRVAEEENMKGRPLSPTPVAMNSNDSMVNEVTVTLGLDILQKMNVIFGEDDFRNGGPVEQECSLNVPLWILEQLYHVWRKDSTQSQHDEDAQLAAFLQEDENLDNAGDICFRKTGMPISRKLQLKMLVEEFSMCDEQSVQRIFQDNNCDASATRNTLHLMLNPDLDTVEPFTPVTNKGTAIVSPSVRSRKPVANLSQAQEEALQYQMEADLFAEKRKEQVQKMQRYIRSGLPSAVGAYQQEKAANVIIEAHQHSPFLDLHLLSQKDAIALLKSRLAALDRPENARNGRSDRRLRVITGYGKSSGGRSVIKPAVESYLKNKGYQ
ncbi:unnamed protein product [Nippostrongylus brasiliensis]|uniref:Smr domain-containing protein n=1 Tax=Nippostrongylus brasiliensis TaxID=27835 RepID=A0A0N4YUC7_NIPBR|nr:unnamed protein product [Nippostrongylus brasiliensis]